MAQKDNSDITLMVENISTPGNPVSKEANIDVQDVMVEEVCLTPLVEVELVGADAAVEEVIVTALVEAEEETEQMTTNKNKRDATFVTEEKVGGEEDHIKKHKGNLAEKETEKESNLK